VALNEAGYSPRVGLSSMSFFLLSGMLMYKKMTSYEEAVRTGNRLISKDSNVKDEDYLVQVELAPTAEEIKSLETVTVKLVDEHTNDDRSSVKCLGDIEQRQYEDEIRGSEITKGEWDQEDTVHINTASLKEH
jgi:hypothetical protein